MSNQQPPVGPTPPEGQQPPEQPTQQMPSGSPYAPDPTQKSGMSPGLVIGLIVALVLVAGALVVGAFLIANDGDEPPAAQESSSSDDSDSGGDDSEDADAEDGEESEDPEASGESLAGEGYSYPLPDGWQDATQEVQDQNPGTSIDSVSVQGASFATANANVLIEVGPTGGESDVTALQPAWEGNIENGGGDPIAIEDTEIGGDRAVGIRTERVNAAGAEVNQIAYLVIHEDSQFSIALSYPAGETEIEDTFEDILEGWSWE